MEAYRLKYLKFVLVIPILNSLATITVNYFNSGTLNPGTVRALIIVSFIIFFIFRSYKNNSINNAIIFYMLYLLFLTFLSSNFFFSFYNYVKVFIAFFMIPIGIFFFKDKSDLKKLNNVFLIVLLLNIVNFSISNVFKLGSSDYLEDTVYFGSGRVNIAKSVSMVLLTTPIFLQFHKKKIIRIVGIIAIFFGALIVFLAVKRSALLALILGFFVYIIFSPNKAKKIKFLIIIGLLATITSSFYLETILVRFEAREERFEFTDPEFQDEENRVKEVNMVLSDFSNRNVFQVLFGTEFFNDREYYHTRRMLHTDYMSLLHGTGIVGFAWFYFIYLLLIRKIRFYTWRSGKS